MVAGCSGCARTIAGIWLICATLIGACEPSRHVVFTALNEAEAGAGGAGSGGGNPGSGGAGAGGSDLDQRPAADPFLDPDVHFVWKETVPGMGGCQAGTYVGRFKCTQDGALPLPIEGNLNFRLEGSEEAQVLTIVDGNVSGYSSMLTGELLRGTLEGTLDCVTDEFDAHTKDGEVFAAPFATLFPFLSGGAFDGTLAGSIDKSTATIEGDWTMKGSLNCKGDFDAALSL